MPLTTLQLTENDKRFLSLWPQPDSRWLELQAVADRVGVPQITAASALSRLCKKGLLEKRGDKMHDGGAVTFKWFTTELGDSIVTATDQENLALSTALKDEMQRLDWMDHNRSANHDSDSKEHWISAWVPQGAMGNKHGASGRFVARAKTFRECIDKFLGGDITRVD